MVVTLELSQHLAKVAGFSKLEREHEAPLVEFLQGVASENTAFKGEIFSGDGNLEPHALISVNDELITYNEMESYKLQPGDVVKIHLMLAGG